jgi:hypothetical protein
VIDNSTLILPFVPEKADGDTFIYTEMLDRGKRKGNNGHRLVKTFYHRSREEFAEQLPVIRQLCDMTNTRACTRLAPRSYKKVGREFTRLVVESALSDNWAGMKSLYNRACGIVSPNEKLWLFDVDAIDVASNNLAEKLAADGFIRARIPSKKGEHLITCAFDARNYLIESSYGWRVWGEVALHKDNPTNLYIPDGAE